MHKTEKIELICPKCQNGILILHVEIYTERQMLVEVLLYNLRKLDKPILKYGDADEEVLGLGYSLHCANQTSDASLSCSFERFFDDENELDTYVRYLFSSGLSSEKTLLKVDKKFISLVRRDQIVD